MEARGKRRTARAAPRRAASTAGAVEESANEGARDADGRTDGRTDGREEMKLSGVVGLPWQLPRPGTADPSLAAAVVECMAAPFFIFPRVLAARCGFALNPKETPDAPCDTFSAASTSSW